MGLSHDQARRGIHSLHGDGLVDIHVGGRGRCMEVEIVNRRLPASDERPVTSPGEAL
jgi:hypothetical protein